MRRFSLVSSLIVSAFACLAGASPALSQQLYVPTNSGSGSTLLTIDSSTFAVTEQMMLPLLGPDFVASPDGSVLYGTTGSSIVVINPGTGAVIATIPLGAQPGGMAITPDGTKLYVSDGTLAPNLGNSISLIDTATNKIVSKITVGNEPSDIAISPDGRTAYIANTSDNTISVVDTATGTVSQIILLNSLNAAGNPSALSITPDGTQLYVTFGANFIVGVIDTATNTIAHSIFVGLGPGRVAFTPDGKTAYVGVSFVNNPAPPINNVLVAIDTGTATVTHNIPLPEGPFAVQVSPDGKNVFALGFQSLMVVPTATNIFASDIPLSMVGQTNFSVGGMTLGGFPSLAAADLPSGRSVEVGSPATLFASVINGSANDLQNCRIGLRGPVPTAATVSFQTTDPSNNQTTGQQNQPVTIAAGAAQSFLLAVTASAPLSLPAEPLLFTCDGLLPAPVIAGVNTVDLLFSASPIADVVAIAETGTADNTLTVPLSQQQQGAFALASQNVGATDTITVSADTGATALPLNILVCQTGAGGACLAAPAPTVTLSYAASATPTFSFFVAATGEVDFAPATARIFVRFKDAGGSAHGSTSVAVKTS